MSHAVSATSPSTTTRAANSGVRAREEGTLRRGVGRQLPLGRRLRRRVPWLPLLLQRRRLRGARHRCGRPARLVPAELDDDETADLVELVERDAIGEPRSGLGQYLVGHWDALALVAASRSSTGCEARLPRRVADHRVKEGCSRWPGTTRPATSPTATRTAGARSSSSARAVLARAPVPADEHAALVRGRASGVPRGTARDRHAGRPRTPRSRSVS